MRSRSSGRLVGSSDVGKSTLINSLMGEEVLEAGDIREADNKGRHTTTARSLHLISTGDLLLGRQVCVSCNWRVVSKV